MHICPNPWLFLSTPLCMVFPLGLLHHVSMTQTWLLHSSGHTCQNMFLGLIYSWPARKWITWWITCQILKTVSTLLVMYDTNQVHRYVSMYISAAQLIPSFSGVWKRHHVSKIATELILISNFPWGACPSYTSTVATSFKLYLLDHLKIGSYGPAMWVLYSLF